MITAPMGGIVRMHLRKCEFNLLSFVETHNCAYLQITSNSPINKNEKPLPRRLPGDCIPPRGHQ